MKTGIRRFLPIALLLLLLVGCASGIPPAIREAPAGPGLRDVRLTPDAYLGRRVRWGGRILAVRNETASTEIELLGQPLDAAGEPKADAEGIGRFIAAFAGFEDPVEYPKDRSLTVVGTLTGVETREIGKFPYRYPVIAVDQVQLWPEPPPIIYYPTSYGYPWYDPWYAPYPFPWYYPRHRHHRHWR